MCTCTTLQFCNSFLAFLSPLTSFAFAVAVSVPEEVLPVHAVDLFPRQDVAEDPDAGPVATGGHKLKKSLDEFKSLLRVDRFKADLGDFGQITLQFALQS